MRRSNPLASLLLSAVFVSLELVSAEISVAQGENEFLTLCGGGTGALPSPFIRDGSSIYYSAANGRVGINTTNPLAELDVNGIIRGTGFSLGNQSLDQRYLRADTPQSVTGANIDPTTVQRRITGVCTGSQSYITAVREDGGVECSSSPTGLNLQPFVSYEFGPAFVEATSGSATTLLRRRYIARGYLRSLPDGELETRTILHEDIREAGTNSGVIAIPDVSPLGENSKVICDTGYNRVTSLSIFSSSCFARLTNIGAVVAYFQAPVAPHQLPILRSAVSNPAFTSFAKCGQYPLDAPYSDRQSNQSADANGACYGTRIAVVGNVPFIGDGVPTPVPGQGIAAEPATATQICRMRGYISYATYSVAGYNSCGDNALYLWNGTDFQLRSACGLPGRITALSCIRFE